MRPLLTGTGRHGVLPVHTGTHRGHGLLCKPNTSKQQTCVPTRASGQVSSALESEALCARCCLCSCGHSAFNGPRDDHISCHRQRRPAVMPPHVGARLLRGAKRRWLPRKTQVERNTETVPLRTPTEGDRRETTPAKLSKDVRLGVGIVGTRRVFQDHVSGQVGSLWKALTAQW